MMSVGHGATGAPGNMVGGSALGNVTVPKSQHKLDQLADKMKKKAEEPAPSKDKEPDWDSLIGEKLDRFSRLIRSEVIRIKINTLKDKIKS